MTNTLYFVPILMRALDAPERRDALRRAFEEIIAMGREPQNARGYAQFLAFMAVVAESIFPEEKLLAADAPGLLRTLADCPELEDLLESISEQIYRSQRLPENPFVLTRNGNAVSSRIHPDNTDTWVFCDLEPGSYALAFWTGRVLWEERLSRQYLVAAYAFPNEPLELAADMGVSAARPTRTITLLGGELQMLLFPGRAAGRMELRRCGA